MVNTARTRRSIPGSKPAIMGRNLGFLIMGLFTWHQAWWGTPVAKEVDWKLVNVTPIYKKDQKEDPGNYRPVSLTSVLRKVMEQIILSVIMCHIQDNQVIRPSQHGFMKGRSCLTNLISFYDRVTFLVDEGKAVKTFNTVFHNILLEKLAAHGLDGCTLCCVKTFLDGQTQSCGEWS